MFGDDIVFEDYSNDNFNEESEINESSKYNQESYSEDEEISKTISKKMS